MTIGGGWPTISGWTSNPYVAAEAYSQANFNQLMVQGNLAAFGADSFGRAPAGPIQNIVNRVASQLNGGGQSQLAGLFPASNPWQTQYFGPPVAPITQTAFGLSGPFQTVGFSNPNPLAAIATTVPYHPGNRIPNVGDGGLYGTLAASNALWTHVAPTVISGGFPSYYA